MGSESPAGIIAQAAVAVALIGAAATLAYVDASVRGQLAGALLLGIGSATGYFFSQRSSASGMHAATNGMSTMAGLIASATPGPAGPAGPRGRGVAAVDPTIPPETP